MAAKKKTTTRKTASKAKATPKKKAPRKRLGEVALVLRVPKEAIAYIDAQAGDRPRTAWLREVLSKGDAKLAKILAAE